MSSSGGLSSPSSQSQSSGSEGAQGSSASSTQGSSSSSAEQSGSGSEQSQSDTTSGMESSDPSQAGSSQTGTQNSNMGSMSSGQSASSIFNESLGVFDKEMAGERIVIASSGEGPGGMSGQESADAAAVKSGVMEGIMGSGDMADGAETGSSEKEQQGETSEKNDLEKTDCNEEECSPMPEDIDALPTDAAGGIKGEDVIARQIRQAAIEEDDPLIREALWDEYRKHMGIK